MDSTSFKLGDFVTLSRGCRRGVVVRVSRTTGGIGVIWEDEPEWVASASRFHLRPAVVPPPLPFLRDLVDAYRVVADLPRWSTLVTALRQALHRHVYGPLLRVIPGEGRHGR